MGRFGNQERGLLRYILQVIYDAGQTNEYDTDWVTRRVEELGYWQPGSRCKTPERTVNSYFSRNSQIFDRVGENRYCLRIEWYRVPEMHPPLDGLGMEVPNRVETRILRTVRATELIDRLKLIHGDRCQICGVAVSIATGRYSEGHHIQPLGKNGPDLASNILILCPNHHVECDYGARPLDLAGLRQDWRHEIGQRFIDWHNRYYFPNSVGLVTEA